MAIFFKFWIGIPGRELLPKLRSDDTTFLEYKKLIIYTLRLHNYNLF